MRPKNVQSAKLTTDGIGPPQNRGSDKEEITLEGDICDAEGRYSIEECVRPGYTCDTTF